VDNYLQRLREIWGPDPNDPSTALSWIEKTVERKAEEGLYLDFKQKSDRRDPALNDDDKANLAKAISGFANTDGGLIVWGVKAKAEKKDDPDVAVEHTPISNLKTFQTWLNALSGELVNPPVAGVESRFVLRVPNADLGYVITVVPKKRDTLVQANAKTCKGFYIRSGSGFHQLPEPLIAEFYRRKPSPTLRLSLRLAEPEQAQFVEEVIEVEHWKQMATFDERKPWGHCTFQQNLAVEWVTTLKNEGLGSANQVAVDLRVPASTKWRIISFKVEKGHYRGSSGEVIPSYGPVSTTCFEAVAWNQAVGKVLEPIHPGQQIKVASGVLHIPFEAFEGNIAEFEVSGFAYATDSPPFSLGCRIDGSELRARYLQAFEILRAQAPQITRVISEPHNRAIKFDE
jgi:Putative DNA-binding domain